MAEAVQGGRYTVFVKASGCERVRNARWLALTVHRSLHLDLLRSELCA